MHVAVLWLGREAVPIPLCLEFTFREQPELHIQPIRSMIALPQLAGSLPDLLWCDL